MMNSFAEFYDSPLQQPGLLMTGAILGLIYVAWNLSRRPARVSPSLKGFFLGFAIISILDAWLTANDVWGLGKLPASLSGILPLFFVYLGDLRYFWFQDLAASPSSNTMSEKRPKRMTRSVAVAAFTPIVAGLIHRHCLPAELQVLRGLFLTYEVIFIFVLLIHQRLWGVRLPAVRAATQWVLGYYVLWAASDILILTWGVDWAFGTRTIANLLYYAGLIPWMVKSYGQFADGELQHNDSRGARHRR